MGVGVPLVFLLITAVNLKNAYLAGHTVSWVVTALADLVFTAQLVYVLITRLIPALKGDTALEFNNDGIADYIRKIEIDWKDVKDINFEQSRKAKMVIDLKEETDYGRQIAISLKWVAGNDKEICETAMAYLEEVNKAD